MNPEFRRALFASISRAVCWTARISAGRAASYGPTHLERLRQIRKLQQRGLTLADIARSLGGAAAAAPQPSAWWHYQVSPDVTVSVRADAAPWRLKRCARLCKLWPPNWRRKRNRKCRSNGFSGGPRGDGRRSFAGYAAALAHRAGAGGGRAPDGAPRFCVTGKATARGDLFLCPAARRCPATFPRHRRRLLGPLRTEAGGRRR